MTNKSLTRDFTREQKKLLLKRMIQEKVADSAPLSYGQRAIWYEQQLLPAVPVFNIAFGMRILSEPDVTALQTALQKIVDRHASLRTTYHIMGQKLLQYVHIQKKMTLKLHDTQDLPKDEFTKLLHETAYKAFALEKGPLMRADMFWREPGRHLLLLSFHHIAVDTWSLVLLFKDFLFFYTQNHSNGHSVSGPQPTAYTEFVRWQQNMLNGAEGSRLWHYWQQKLSGRMLPAELPCDFTPGDLPSAAGGMHPFQLEPELTTRLRDMVRDRGVTLYSVLLAAFCVLLYRYSQHPDDVYIQTITSGRDQSQFADTVGFFANPVIVHAELADNPTFEDFLARLTQTVQEAIVHQGFPFPLLLEKMAIGPHERREYLSDILFVMESSHHLMNALQPDKNSEEKPQLASGIFTPGDTDKRISTDGLVLTGYSLNKFFTQNDLTLEMAAEEGISGAFHYRSALFRPETIESMAGHYQRILKNAASQPGMRAADLEFLSDEELYRILVQWNDTGTELSGSHLIHGLFSEQAARTPHAEALRFKNQSWTYLELEQESNKLANYLKSFSLQEESIVALYMQRSPQAIIAMLSVLKAGAAFLPLDHQHPQERLRYILGHAPVRIVIMEGNLPFPLEDADYILVDLEIDALEISKCDATCPVVSISEKSLAYVFYTSGSTGAPKGVMVEHRNVVNMIGSFNSSYQVSPLDRVLQQAPLFFDVCIGEIFPVLCAGGVLCIPCPEDLVSMENRLRFIADNEITVLAAAPSLLALYNVHADQIPSLRLILSGGEALVPSDIERLVDRVTVANGYGLTETTVCSTYHILNRKDEHGRPNTFSKIPIGRPIANTKIYILAPNGRPLPVGITGEIYIGGAGVARGYLHLPDLTADRFIPDPFSRDGDRLFRTGDVGRYLPNGDIDFLGRIDEQIKIRGLRIEPGEIEANLMKYPDIRDATVVMHEDKHNRKMLIGYLVCDKNSEVDVRNIQNFLALRLPDYMVPVSFVILDRIPLTPSGKIDQKSLPLSDIFIEKQYVAPRNETEAALAEIWQQVLQIEFIGAKSPFFELGGNSLRAIQIIGEANAIGLRVSPSDFMANPTIAELASVCHRNTENPSAHTYLTRLTSSTKKPALFLAPALTGFGLCYLELTRLLPKDLAVYAFQNPGLFGEQKPLNTMQALTRFFLNQLQDYDPEGPYLLGGFSFGGAIAFALAQQLESNNRRIDGVFLIEAGMPEQILPSDKLSSLYAYIAAQGDLDLSLQQLRMLPERACFDYLLKNGKKVGILPENTTYDMIRHILDVAYGNIQAFNNFTPTGQIQAPVYYFRAQAGLAYNRDAVGSYQKFCNRPITIFPTPGDHFQILRQPNVEMLARFLNEAIDACQA